MTNVIESVNMPLHKVIKIRGSFPTNEAAVKLLYPALQNITKKRTTPINNKWVDTTASPSSSRTGCLLTSDHLDKAIGTLG